MYSREKQNDKDDDRNENMKKKKLRKSQIFDIV